MPDLVVGIGDIEVTNDPDCHLKTYALGSCIAVVIYDKDQTTAGMAHIALPDSRVNKQKSESKPGYFADTGIPELLRQLKKKKSTLKNNDLIVKIIGGANVIKNEQFFNIGEMNAAAVKSILKNNGLRIHAEDTGKDFSRTVDFHPKRNRCLVKNRGVGEWEI